jgi:hypothetical protein
MPCSSLARPLPKGATGIQHCKELHDDGNAALIPGIWTSIRGDENVVLRFLGKNMNVYFKAADFRFCWFYGWVPHKTEIQPGAHVQQVSAEGKMGTISRVHHSAFSKPELEHLGLVLFSKKHRKKVVKSYSHQSPTLCVIRRRSNQESQQSQERPDDFGKDGTVSRVPSSSPSPSFHL